MKRNDPSTPIEYAIKLAGSEAKLAKAAGSTQATIWRAKKSGRPTAELATKIEKATNGLVPRWMLRPDLWERPATSSEHEEKAA